MKAYISVSYNNRRNISKILKAITETLQDAGVSPFVFVDTYTFPVAEEKQMMAQAMHDIDACGILIAEVSDKAIGIGVEAGYAKAKGIPVIYIRQKDAEHSTTMAGISDYQIFYKDDIDLKNKLSEIIRQIILQKKVAPK
ncbi:MAG: nucleoside 2-deoxyribosyltransferase [Chitinophagaceae bacterium]